VSRLLASVLALASFASAGSDADVLAASGIEVTPDGLRAYFRRILPAPGDEARIDALIARLGDGSGALRAEAMRRLTGIPFGSGGALRRAAGSHDPEVRRRVALILEARRGNAHLAVLEAAFRAIDADDIPGLAEPVIAAIPVLSDSYLLDAARNALVATVQPDDAGLLETAAANRHAEVRRAVAAALPLALGARAPAALRTMLRDADDRVRLAAAEALARQGDRSCLATLGVLLEADDIDVRVRSVMLLRAATGLRFDYLPYDDPPRRAATAASWRQWIAGEGAHVELRTPLEIARPFLGRTLVCVLSNNKGELIEYDRQGRETFRSPQLQLPWGCEGLADGNRLVAIYNAQAVIEYDVTGREVWRCDNLPGHPMSVRRLDNGHTLLACSDADKVIEIARDGRIRWQVELKGRPVDARRLENGNTLVALYNGKRVVEVTPSGKVVWEVACEGSPSSATRLENGNTLVSGVAATPVCEFDRQGAVVWSVPAQVIKNCYEAQRLPDGHTLISTYQGWTEVDRGGNIVAEKRLGACRAIRY